MPHRKPSGKWFELFWPEVCALGMASAGSGAGAASSVRAARTALPAAARELERNLRRFKGDRPPAQQNASIAGMASQTFKQGYWQRQTNPSPFTGWRVRREILRLAEQRTATTLCDREISC